MSARARSDAIFGWSQCERYGVVPVRVAGRALIVAMVDPENAGVAIAELGALTGMEITAVRASVDAIRRTMLACYLDVN